MNQTIDWDIVSSRLKGEDMAAKEETKPGLVAKLAEVMGLMRNVPKEGFNKAQSYRFVREDDVARMASSLLAERKVWIHQTVLETSAVDLYKTQSGLGMRMTIVRMAFQFIDGETGEVTPVQEFVGTGADTGDKGIYKAMTGAEKYFLMKSFLVSTGDDPEGDEKVDKATAATEAAEGARTTVRRASNGTVRRGGRSEQATEAQLAELRRLAKDLGVKGDGMMAVVREVMTTGGAKVPEWADTTAFAAYLRGMSAVEMGALLVGVTARLEEKNGDEPDDSIEVVEVEGDDLDLE